LGLDLKNNRDCCELCAWYRFKLFEWVEFTAPWVGRSGELLVKWLVVVVLLACCYKKTKWEPHPPYNKRRKKFAGHGNGSSWDFSLVPRQQPTVTCGRDPTTRDPRATRWSLVTLWSKAIVHWLPLDIKASIYTIHKKPKENKLHDGGWRGG